MSDLDELRQHFARKRVELNRAVQDPRRARRIERARQRLRWAYSPIRILMLLGMAPVVAGAMTLSVYVATSPFDPQDALGHMVAMGGCEAAAVVGLAPARSGDPGYHAKLDTDGDGMSCRPADLEMAGADAAMPGAGETARQAGGAKFLRPGE